MRKKLSIQLATALLCLGSAFMVLLPQQANAQCPFTADFTSSQVYVCAGQSVSFTNTTSPGANIFGWLENSTPFAFTTNATRTFSLPGNYLISLISSNGTCQDTASTVVVVTPQPGSSISSNNAICFGASDGSVNLSPTPGTPNVSLDNVRANNDYVSANSVTSSGFTTGLTMEAWLKPRSTWNASDGLAIAFNDPGGGNRCFMGYNATNQQFVYFDGFVGNRFQVGTIAPGVWTHFAVTITPGTNQVRLYINGVLNRTFNTNASWLPIMGDLFSLGQEYDGGLATSQHFDGCIDEVRIYNAPLSAATILTDYQSCASISPTHPNIGNLKAYYSMNEGGGSFIFDRSGNDNHGTRFGTAWCNSAGSNWGCFAPATGYGYTWNNAATTEDLAAVPAGTYSVTITDGAGCQVTNSATVGQPSPLVISSSSNPGNSICFGNSTQVTATGAQSYVWSPATGLSGTTGTTVTASPGSSTTYTVIGTDANGCKDTITVPITVNALPTASITGTNVICLGDTAVLTAAGATGFAWSTSATTASISVSPTTNTTYTVTVTDGNTCTDTAQFNVTVNALPTVSFSGNTTICTGDTTQVTASGGTGYSWSTGALTATAALSPTTTTTYTVTVTDNNSCENTGTVAITVNALPVVTFTGNDTICLGSSTTITAGGGTGYAWSSGDLTAAATLSPTVNTTYSVTVTDGNSCENTDSIEIVVNPLPTASISGTDTICAGQSTTLTASGGVSYVWDNSATTTSITVTPAASGPVSVVATDGNGCTDADTIQITVIPQLVALINPLGNIPICEGDSIVLDGSGSSGTNYLWSTSATTSSITVSPSSNTTYALTVSDGSSCDGTDSVIVSVNPLPATPVITQVGNTLTATPGFASYQWFLNGNPVGTNSNTYGSSTDGNVTVTVTDANGCSATSAVFMFVGVENGMGSGLTIDLYPNPNNGLFTLQLESDVTRDLEITAFDLAGRQVYAHNLSLNAGKWSGQINLESVAKGVYILQVRSGAMTDYRKVIVE